MIVVKTPLRISFVGGGSDHLISENSFGSVISIGINKFIYLSIIKTDGNTSKISYSKKKLLQILIILTIQFLEKFLNILKFTIKILKLHPQQTYKAKAAAWDLQEVLQFA